jgi:hypothetical protein
MSKDKFEKVAWSTILKQSPSMPRSIKDKKRGIYLGKNSYGSIRVVKRGNATYGTYSPDFWDVDNQYMSDREEIANLLGRIAESNEPTNIQDYKSEIDTIQRKMEL